MAETQATEKLFYTISEVAAKFDVNASLIRYWENEFDILQPKKNAKGNRLFTEKDIETLGLIYHYVKERGMTLKGAQQKIKQNRDEAEHNYRIVQSLQDIRTQLLEIKESIDNDKTVADENQ